MNQFPFFQNENKSFMSRKWRKYGLKKRSVMNDFPCFQNENKSHLCQENGRNID